MRKSINLLILLAMVSLVSACGNNGADNKASNNESTEIETTIEETTTKETTAEETTVEETTIEKTTAETTDTEETSESSDGAITDDGNTVTNREVKAKVWVQDSYSGVDQGSRASGKVEFGTFYVSDETYLIKKDGTEIKLDVKEILQARVPVDKVEEGDGVSVVISNLDRESIERDDYIVIY